MLAELIKLLIVVSVVSCQIDGEFWWLNSDITKLKHGTAQSPKFDDVNELDTDETAKIVFRDNGGKKGKSLKTDKETIGAILFRDETELATPTYEFDQLNVNNKLWERPLKQTNIQKQNASHKIEDEFKFVFPSDDNLLWINTKNDIKNKQTSSLENSVVTSNKIKNYSTTTIPKISPHNGVSPIDKNPLHPENICTYIKKLECIRNGGILYEPWMKPNIKSSIPNTKIICCILPITTTSIAEIIFPDNYWSAKRHKRSNVDSENPTLKQWNTLMNRKYTSQNQKMRVTTPLPRKKTNQKIANSDEYPTDPYWNIKNANIRNQDIPVYQDPDTGSDYGSHNYDDYTVELPKPGLIGLYSDHKQQTNKQTPWTGNKNKGFYYDTSDSIEDEEFETSFGYSTIDPRQDHRMTSVPSKRFRPRPLKLIATTSRFPEPSLENPTITFHSNPDFQVLQGFKLLNLMRSKNRFVRKTIENNKDCTNIGSDAQEKPTKIKNYSDNSYEDDSFEANLKQKMFNDCGKSYRDRGDCENGLEQGTVEFGSHPWVVLVILTKSEHNILCYATLVHSRVAVTIADCVNGKPPGATSIVAGVRNLETDLTQSQRRMATVALDPDYTPGKLQHNLALLHWLRPVMFDVRTQPACLGDPHVESSCIFAGWGGYDQEIHTELRWQRASILTPQNCNKRLSKLEVSDALCAAVESRGTVTGVGGPLLCKSNERWSIVGVAVWRNDVIIILPTREWVLSNMISLRIQ